MRISVALVAVGFVLMLSVAAQAVDKGFVNETHWKVSAFEDKGNGLCTGPIHPVQWSFHANGTVNAGSIWSGSWKTLGDNRVHMKISFKDSSEKDEFDVVFVSSEWFVGIKDKQIFRMGLRWN
jgi:hypothetical protein